MDFDQYVAARYGRLIEHAVLLGCAEGEAGTQVDQVLLAQRKRIRRAEDPDPLVREALERAIAGGGRGAAIGSAAGAGVGAGANTITRGEQVQIPSESVVNFTLTDTLTIRVSTSDASGSTTPRQRRRPINSPDGAGQDQPQ